MGCTFFWVKIISAFTYFVVSCLLPDGAFIQYKYLNRVYFECKTKLCLGRQGKYIFTQESFYLQGILNGINEQDRYFLNCKHKHMMKSGAPPDNVGVLHRLLPKEFHGVTSRIDF